MNGQLLGSCGANGLRVWSYMRVHQVNEDARSGRCLNLTIEQCLHPPYRCEGPFPLMRRVVVGPRACRAPSCTPVGPHLGKWLGDGVHSPSGGNHGPWSPTQLIRSG